ncbi:hypothetical protein BC941DRAFT_397762 [Chlamydoabsidia padenii]|nr:hypothetical protein BC941DRAFT_397762 [Chlamydoabsidia padenii]
MKFGDYLSQQRFMPWNTQYLEYDRIKALIREEKTPQVISQWIQTEYIKVQSFLSQKTNALDHQLSLFEQHPGGQLDELIHPLYELHELARYLNLSVAGFEKLSKSVNKHKGMEITHHSTLLDHWHSSLQELLIRIARVKQKRTLKKRSKAPCPLPPDPNQEQVTISYYWIHPDHVYELKALLLFYCDLNDHYALSTKYLDNHQWQVYYSLLNHQSSESIELSWRPNDRSTHSTVQVEHIEKSDTGINLIKRHSIPQTSVDSLFRRGPPPPNKAGSSNTHSTRTALVVEPQQKKTNIDNSRLVRQKIQQHDWQPMITCTRQRWTFTPTEPHPCDIYIDTNMDQQDTSCPSLMVVVQPTRVTRQYDWLKRLVNDNDWIQAVPNFSYHVHFVATRFSEEVAFLPWWLDSFDSSSRTTTNGLTWSVGLLPLLFGAPPPWQTHVVVELDKEDDDDDDKKMLLPSSNPRRKARRKPAITKVKVEPKVFFANERTFLSWLQFCALLLTVSLNMINFGGQNDQISRGCGAMFMVLTILMALYALAKYEFRAWNLLTRSTHYRFDDIYGPAILCFLLVVAMLINIGLRLTTPSSPPLGNNRHHNTSLD